MKKTLLLLFALMTSIGMAWADDPVNLALNKTATCSEYEGGRTANSAIDGNMETLWGSNVNPEGEGRTKDNAWWMVDLGENFNGNYNYVVISWDNEPAKKFKIQTSTNGTDWTDVYVDDDDTNEPENKTCKYALNSTQNARYVKFQGVQRASGYGYGFYEFKVFNIQGEFVLTSIQITANKTKIGIDEKATFTAIGRDQVGVEMTTEGITWLSSNPEKATIENGVLTGVSAGSTTVTAQIGNVISNSIDIEVAAGTKVDLFTNWQYRIYTIGEKTTRNSLVGAFDENEGSDWSLLNGVFPGESEQQRTYDAGFIADLGAIYDVNEISIKFEGACSQEYTISFAGNDGVFGEAVYNGGTHQQGTNAHTEVLNEQTVSGVRYVKFLSTKAATQYGIRIFDFNVIGNKKSDIDNSQTPSITAATITNPTNESLQLNITCSDDSPYILYLVTGAGSERWLNGKTGISESFVITGLEEGTEYNLSIIAYDAVAHGSSIFNISGTTTGGVIDEEAPVMVSATLASKTYNSATLTLNATDNSDKVKFHIVDATNNINVTTGLVGQGADFEYTVTGLTPETTYNFTVTAEDAAGNTSENNVVMTAFTTEAIPAGQEYINGDHSIFLSSYHYTGTDIYELIITSNEVMTGLGGSFWYTSSDKTDLREDLFISSDRKAMSIRTTSTYDPSLYTPLYILMPGEINFGDVSLTWIETPAEQATVTNAQWASFSSTSGLDFSNVVGLTAYKATATTAASVHYEKVSTAAANTGLVLNGDNTEARTYYIPVKNNAASHNDNLLKGTAYGAKTISSEEAATNKFLAFGKKSGQIGFVKVGSNGYTVPTGKAYLELTSALAARDYSFISLPGDNGETTSIESLNISQFDNNAPMYNLSGQRVGNNYKGIVIVNGKKMIRK